MQVSVRERTLATHLKSPAVFTFEHSRRLPQAMGTVMKDIHAKLEKLLTEAEDCELIGRLATDVKKRQLFKKLAANLRSMARDIEAVVAGRRPEAE